MMLPCGCCGAGLCLRASPTVITSLLPCPGVPAALAAAQVYLLGVRLFFEEGATCAWNRAYDKARMVRPP